MTADSMDRTDCLKESFARSTRAMDTKNAALLSNRTLVLLPTTAYFGAGV